MQRSARMAELPGLISAASRRAQDARDAGDGARRRGDYKAALEFSTTAEDAGAKESRLRVEYADMERANTKAVRSQARARDNASAAMQETPTVSAPLWGSMRADLFEKATEMASTMATSSRFSRASTLATNGTIRVSPLSLSLADYALIKLKFCHDLGHSEQSACRCKVPIAAAAVLGTMEESDRMTVKDLWKRAGGSTSVTSAQSMLGTLMWVRGLCRLCHEHYTTLHLR